MSLKVCITTSDRYHHLLPVFFYLYGRYWNEPFDLVGHAKPDCELPENCTWVSMGPQTGPKDWSTGLRRYFEQQPDSFVWMMEDTLLKATVDRHKLNMWGAYCIGKVGRIDLTNDMVKRPHERLQYGSSFVDDVYMALPDTKYRQSTQPAIWNRNFLLRYMTDGLTPWEFETQPTADEFLILGSTVPTVLHNEGVRRFDIYKLNLDGMCPEDIAHIKTLAPWMTN